MVRQLSFAGRPGALADKRSSAQESRATRLRKHERIGQRISESCLELSIRWSRWSEAPKDEAP
jgi:hypothetical protein